MPSSNCKLKPLLLGEKVKSPVPAASVKVFTVWLAQDVVPQLQLSLAEHTFFKCTTIENNLINNFFQK